MYNNRAKVEYKPVLNSENYVVDLKHEDRIIHKGVETENGRPNITSNDYNTPLNNYSQNRPTNVNTETKSTPNNAISGFSSAQPLTNRDYIAKLHPEFAPSVVTFINNAAKENIILRINSGYRSPEDTARLKREFEAGSKSIIHEPAAESKHNYGFAIDVTPIRVNGTVYSTANQLPCDNSPNNVWNRLSVIANKSGLKWLGCKDKVHFESPLTLDQCREKFNQNQAYVSLVTKNSNELTKLATDAGNKLGIDPNWILKLIHKESGGNPKSVNKQNNNVVAGGLFQFTKVALSDIGFDGTPEDVANLPAEDQFDLFVKRYSKYRGKINSYGDLVLLHFFPAAYDNKNNPNTVIASGGSPVYTANSGLDLNKDNQININEIITFYSK